jgi:hypothetical protein
MSIYFIKDINKPINNFLNNINQETKEEYFMNEKIPNNFNNFIKNINEKEEEFIKINIEYSIKCLNNLDIKLKNQNKELNYDLWKICVFDKMFFNLPFTLEDIIFIPIGYIKKSINNNNIINKNFSKTLIHEKIHLLQRYNQNIWNNYIIQNTKWILTNKEFITTSCLLNNNIIHNPDTYYVENKFIYEDNKKYYYGNIIIINNKIDTLWYECIIINNQIKLYINNNYNKKYEHPYEELAYILAEKLNNS